MGETSYVKQLTGRGHSDAAASQHKTEEPPPWRKAFWVDNAGGGNPFSLALRYKDGRAAEGFANSLYARHTWLDRGGKVERLVLIFSHGGIYLEGRHLQLGLDALEEGRLKAIREQGETDIRLIERHNLDIRPPERKEPIVSRIVVSPSFEDAVESDRNLVEIAKVMREQL